MRTLWSRTTGHARARAKEVALPVQNIALVRSLYEAFAARDVPGLLGFFDTYAAAEAFRGSPDGDSH